MGPIQDFNAQRLYPGERLKKKKSIQRLFGEGHKKNFFPLLLFYLEYKPEDVPYHKVLISVPKKNFKSSVIRNRIRRRIREAFRKQKVALYNNHSGFPFLLGYLYISKTVSTYTDIERSVLSSLRYLTKQNGIKK